jgi:hypothetical protein
MAARRSVDHDIVGWMRERLEQASPDLLREMVQTFAEALGAGAEALCNPGVSGAQPGADECAQWLPGSGLGYPGWQHRVRDPQGRYRQLLPALAAGTTTPVGGGAGLGRGKVRCEALRYLSEGHAKGNVRHRRVLAVLHGVRRQFAV